MQIAQRIGQGGTTAIAGGTKAYSLDRWQVSAGAGSSVSVAQGLSPGLAGFQFFMRVQRVAGNTATTAIQLAQSMEGYDSYPVQSQTINLSFYARVGANYSATSNALTVQIYTGTGADENVLTGYTGSSVPVSQTFNLTNSWALYQTSGTLGASLTEFGIIFTINPTGTAGTNDYLDITGIQIEIGPLASSYDFRPFSEVFARCQRYYQKSFLPVTAPSTNNSSAGYFSGKLAYAGANQIIQTIVLGTPLRSLATGTIYNPWAANNQIRNVVTSTDFTSSSITTAETTVTISGSAPAGSSQGDQWEAHWSVDCEL